MRVIGNDQNLPRQEHALASGTLPNGKPVIVNSDGTVSVVSLDSATENLGSQASIASNTSGETNVLYDSNANKFLVNR